MRVLTDKKKGGVKNIIFIFSENFVYLSVQERLIVGTKIISKVYLG